MAICPTVRFCGIGLFLCAALQVTGKVLQQSSRCLQNVPEVFPKQQLFVEGKARPILLDSRPGVNPSADFINNIVRTLTLEVLGYEDVRILSSDVDFHNSTIALQRVSGCTDYSCRAVSMPNDASNANINMEVWQDNLVEMSMWLETGTIRVNGFLGFTARYGWFISQTLVAQMWQQSQLIADHWKGLYSLTLIRQLLIPMSELQGLVIVKPAAVMSGKPQRKETRFHCERAECVRGMYVPPVCVIGTSPTAECASLVAGYPDTSFDMLIGQINSLRLPVIVAWIGPELESYVSARIQASQPTLFLSWSPHTLTSSGLFNRISFPTCVQGSQSNSNSNSGCDFRAYPVSKLSWLPLAYSAPDVGRLINEMTFSDFEMLAVLGRFYRNIGKMQEFACEWLQNNPAVWNEWVANKLNPKKKIYLGGLFPDHIPAFNGIGIGAKLAVDAVNDDSDVLISHELELVVDGSDGSDAVASYLRLQDDKTRQITCVIGPMQSDDSKIVASIAALFKTVVISYGADSPVLTNQDLYPYFARVFPSAAEDAYTLAKLFQHYNWKRYAALSDSQVSNLEAITATEGILEEQGICLVSSQSFTTPSPLNPTLYFEDIKTQRARLIIGLFSDTAARVLLCEAFKQDVTGYDGYQWFLPSLYPDRWWDTDFYNSDQHEWPESVPCRTREMALAVAGYMSLSRISVAMGGKRLVGLETASQWQANYQMMVDQQGKQASAYAAYAYDAVWAFALTYESLLQESPGALSMFRQNRDTLSFMTHLSKTQFYGMTGKVVFAGSDRQGPVRISQHHPQGPEVVMSVGLYIPYVINSSEWTGRLQLNTSDIVWLNDGMIPDDGTIDEAECAVESFRSFLGVDCQSAMAILNAFLIIVVFIILIIFVVLVKKAYDRKVKKAEDRIKDLGIIALGQSTLLSLDKWEVLRENVILNRKLGEGAFGTVYGGEAKLNGNQWVGVAVKTLKVESTIEEKLDFLSEAEMMKRFNHKNIVQLLGVCTRREPIYTIMDFMLHGDLKTFLLARRHLVSQSHVDDLSVSSECLTSMVLDIAMGVSYLAANKYVHRDLACRNCLVDCSYTVKIADFGMTRATYDSNYYRLNREGKMPVRWMAPESVSEGIFTSKSDIWSLGIVIYEVVTFGGFPYKEFSNADVLDYIRSNNTMRPPADCSPPLAALMQRCWSIEPEERPTANDIVEILSAHRDLIQPSINEPITSILDEDPAQALASPQDVRGDSLQSDLTSLDFDAPNLSRTDRVASLGRRLRASFVQNLSWNRRRSHTLHNMEMSSPEHRQKSGLESSTQKLVPSTLSVITCTTRSSLTSLDQSMRTSFRSTSAQRDSSSSSGVDCNINDSVSVEIPERKFSLRRSATDSEILDPTDSKTSRKTAPFRKSQGQDLMLPCGVAIQIEDEMHLLPCQRKTRQTKRSRSRSLGNLRSPCTPRKLFKGSCLKSTTDATSSV